MSTLYKNNKFFSFSNFWVAIEHLLAMFPASILVPILINNAVGENVLDVSLVLFMNACGTLLFLLITRGRTPIYLGSSFAYIGLSIYMLDFYKSQGETASSAYGYIMWAYLFSALLLILLSLLFKFKFFRSGFKKLLPVTIIGPAISLIGLELAEGAATDAGFINGSIESIILALCTLFFILLFTLLRTERIRNMSLILGIGAGIFIAVVFIRYDYTILSTAKFFTIPTFRFAFLSIPKNLWLLLLSVIPVTLIIFSENFSRVMIIQQLVRANEYEIRLNKWQRDKNINPEFTGEMPKQDSKEKREQEDEKRFIRSLMGQSASIGLSAIFGSAPNTLYAENIAVMSINSSKKSKTRRNNTATFVPYLITATFCIMISFLGTVQSFLINMPKAVIGGMELFLFGIIAAPGIQLLVDNKVNYKKTSNQLITAAVLIAGIGNIKINIGIVEFKGMSLGILAGIIMNILVISLKYIGWLNESPSYQESYELMSSKFDLKEIESDLFKLQEVSYFTFNKNQNRENIILRNENGELYLSLLLSDKAIDDFIEQASDSKYNYIVKEEKINGKRWLKVQIDGLLSQFMLKKFIREAKKYCE